MNETEFQVKNYAPKKFLNLVSKKTRIKKYNKKSRKNRETERNHNMNGDQVRQKEIHKLSVRGITTNT